MTIESISQEVQISKHISQDTLDYATFSARREWYKESEELECFSENKNPPFNNDSLLIINNSISHLH